MDIFTNPLLYTKPFGQKKQSEYGIGSILYTPKHGSWLNMAEIELNVLMGQCLNRRIGDIEIMQKEVKAWQQNRNNKQATIKWQFNNNKARVKLKRLYPTI